MYVGLSDSQVLATLEKNAAAASASTSPFPLHSQYVPAVLAGRGGDDKNEDSDVEGDSKSPKAKKKKKKDKNKKGGRKPPQKKQKGGLVQEEVVEKTWCYNSIRNEFIQNLRSSGKTFKESTDLWDLSLEKAKYLAPVSVGELKKRRFLPKGSTTNPWFEKVHGPTK